MTKKSLNLYPHSKKSTKKNVSEPVFKDIAGYLVVSGHFSTDQFAIKAHCYVKTCIFFAHLDNQTFDPLLTELKS